MRRTARLAALLALATLAGCAAHLIPNTQLEDTPANRDILEVVRRYKLAYEAKDAKAIDDLASERYLDARENISKSTLTEALQKDFDKVRELQLELNVRRIDVEGERAKVDYFYSTSFLLAANDATWQTETDDKRMELTREDGAWKVVSGF